MQSKSSQIGYNSGFFPQNRKTSWQLIYTGWDLSLFFNSQSNMLLGLGGHNAFGIPEYGISHSPWTIPLRPDSPVKQIAAGENHLLILYDDGILEGLGDGRLGQLGVGFTPHSLKLKAMSITLPHHEQPVVIAASGNSSFVISNTGTLYGFGSNHKGVLGLGKKKEFEFLTPIPIPKECIPERIYTRHERTIIACQNGVWFGFGDNSSGQLGEFSIDNDRLQTTPLRLPTFEKLNPRDIQIGCHAVIVLSTRGQCHFYGIDPMHKIPVNYLEERVISFLPEFQIKQISFYNDTLCILSEQNEVWLTQQQFAKIDLPQNIKIQSIVLGSQSIYICREQLDWYESKDHSFKPVKLKYSGCSYSLKRVPSNYSSPTSLFLEQKWILPCPDYSDLIPILEKDPHSVLEFLSPSRDRQHLFMCMLYGFYSNADSIPLDYWYDKKIGTQQEFIVTHQGQHPVLMLDLGLLNFSSERMFNKSFNDLIINLYLRHRQELFTGYLNTSYEEKLKYQKIILNREELPKNILEQLLKLLYNNYNKKVKVFINNADSYLRQALDNEYFSFSLKMYLSPILSDTNRNLVSQIILMGVHSTPLAINEKHTISTYTNSLYRPYFKDHFESFFIEKNHFIYTLTLTSEHCTALGHLLENNTIKLDVLAGQPPQLEEVNLFTSLIQLGVLMPAARDLKNNKMVYGFPNPAAKELVQQLYDKGLIQNLNRVTVVFDIDGVMTFTKTLSNRTLLFFLQRGLVLNCYGGTHYIPPGIKELVQWLYSMPEVIVAFFGSGSRERNNSFVKEFLIKALGKERYSTIDPIICSHDDLEPCESFQNQHLQNIYHLPISATSGKKNLSKPTTNVDGVEHSILIDDHPEFVALGQVKQYLKAKKCCREDFESLKEHMICEHVGDPLFCKVNSPFYLAGILWDCIKNRNKKPIKEQLFELQFVPQDAFRSSWKPCWDELNKKPLYYLKGLEVLQPFNKQLSFVTSSSYQECTKDVSSINDVTEVTRVGDVYQVEMKII